MRRTDGRGSARIVSPVDIAEQGWPKCGIIECQRQQSQERHLDDALGDYADKWGFAENDRPYLRFLVGMYGSELGNGLGLIDSLFANYRK